MGQPLCSAFDLEMIFHSHANKTHFHKKSCALSLILKMRVFGTRKWPIVSIIFGVISLCSEIVGGGMTVNREC